LTLRARRRSVGQDHQHENQGNSPEALHDGTRQVSARSAYRDRIISARDFSPKTDYPRDPPRHKCQPDLKGFFPNDDISECLPIFVVTQGAAEDTRNWSWNATK
jgi:hypothetical protein